MSPKRPRDAMVRDPAVEALAAAMESVYREDRGADYWMPPLIACRGEVPVGRIRAGDSVIFCCRRGERETQLTRAFVDDPFSGFSRTRLDPLTFVPLTLYHPDFAQLPIAFPPSPTGVTIGEAVSRAGMRQLRLAEREKFAHVTYFFNGGRTTPFPGETDRAVPSDLDAPASALPRLVDALDSELSRIPYEFLVVNLATGDIVGHYQDLEAKRRCAQDVDRALARILDVARAHGYWVGVTADHGLLEDHGPVGGPPNVAHTRNPVPFALLGPNGRPHPVRRGDALRDVAPTLLGLLGIVAPSAMTGRSLLPELPEEPGRVLLVILDGWGLATTNGVNPLETAVTPTWNRLLSGPHAPLAAAGAAVGLLPTSSGNSEAGHMNLGAGATVLQDEVRIERAIEAREFASNPAIVRAVNDARGRHGAVHLIGLLSERSSHGRARYVEEIARRIAGEGDVRLHIHWIADGRSSPPQGGAALLRVIGRALVQEGSGGGVSVIGRGWALDRGGDYATKTRATYRALVDGVGRSIEIA